MTTKIEIKLLRAFVAGEKLKHFDREDAARVLEEILASRSGSIAKQGQLRRQLNKAEQVISATRFRQQRRLDMGRDGGLDALSIVDCLDQYVPKKN